MAVTIDPAVRVRGMRGLTIPPGLRFVARSTWLGLLGLSTIAIALVLAEVAHFHDAYTYFAAGQRLNDGHQLYALGPGDLPVDLNPPYWSVPLLSPPFIAVIWRPLTALGGLGLLLWYGSLYVAMMGAGIALFRRAPLAVAICAPSLGYLWGSGNVNGFIFAAAVAAWFHRDRWWIGIPLGFLAAAKMFPIVFLAFLIAQRNVRGAVVLCISLAVCLVAGVLGAGIDANVEYVRVLVTSAPQPEMLASIIGFQWATPALFAVGMTLIVVLRGRRAYQVAIATLVLGFGFYLAYSSVAVLLALPRRRDEEATAPSSPEPAGTTPAGLQLSTPQGT